MKVNTSRFGSVSIDQNDVITFTKGLLGFNHLTKFVLLDDPTDEIFAWLQSCEEPSIAFPILEPELFLEKYDVKLSKYELEAIASDDISKCRCFTIITIPEDPTQMTANLKAPIVINPKAKLAKQCVLQSTKYEIKQPIFTTLQQRVVQNPNYSFKNNKAEEDIRVHLPVIDDSLSLDL